MTQFTSAWVAIQNAKREKPSPETGRAILASAEREVVLHRRIMEFCGNQFPRWKYVHDRTDIPTGKEDGISDFCIIAPGGRLFIIECKSATGKQTHAQMCWQKEVEMLGHKYHLVISFDEFLKVVEVVK